MAAALLLGEAEQFGHIFAERLNSFALGKLTTVCRAFKDWARNNGRSLRLVLQHPADALPRATALLDAADALAAGDAGCGGCSTVGGASALRAQFANRMAASITRTVKNRMVACRAHDSHDGSMQNSQTRCLRGAKRGNG